MQDENSEKAETFFTKNKFIVFLAFMNVLGFGYIFVTHFHIHAKVAKFLSLSKAGPAVTANRPVKADVEGGSYFKHDSEMQACYESFLAREPDVDEGSVLFHMTLKNDGQIDLLKLVQSDFADERFTACLSDQIKTKRLPAAKAPNGEIIAHRFKFKRKDIDRAEFE